MKTRQVLITAKYQGKSKTVLVKGIVGADGKTRVSPKISESLVNEVTNNVPNRCVLVC